MPPLWDSSCVLKGRTIWLLRGGVGGGGGGGGWRVEDLRKNFLQSLYSIKRNTGQWEKKNSCTNHFFESPPEKSNCPPLKSKQIRNQPFPITIFSPLNHFQNTSESSLTMHDTMSPFGAKFWLFKLKSYRRNVTYCVGTSLKVCVRTHKRSYKTNTLTLTHARTRTDIHVPIYARIVTRQHERYKQTGCI